MRFWIALLLMSVGLTQAQPWKEHDQTGDDLMLRDADMAGAIKEFDMAIKLEPRLGPQHWRRGIALYYAGRFKDGQKQFERHQTVNSNDVENAVWHFLCVTKASTFAEARRKMIHIKQDDRVPMMQVDALFRGTGTEADVLKVSKTDNDLFFAHLYLALYWEAVGDSAKMLEHAALAANKYAPNDYMGMVGKLHYRLRKK